MAFTVYVNKYHLIVMGLYSKQINNEPITFSEEECENLAQAYISDSRRPTTDFMKNTYKYDFSPIKLNSSDSIVYNPQTKKYSLKNSTPVEAINRYLTQDSYGNPITNQIMSYLEILGKEKHYKKKSPQPEC